MRTLDEIVAVAGAMIPNSADSVLSNSEAGLLALTYRDTQEAFETLRAALGSSTRFSGKASEKFTTEIRRLQYELRRVTLERDSAREALGLANAGWRVADSELEAVRRQTVPGGAAVAAGCLRETLQLPVGATLDERGWPVFRFAGMKEPDDVDRESVMRAAAVSLGQLLEAIGVERVSP